MTTGTEIAKPLYTTNILVVCTQYCCRRPGQLAIAHHHNSSHLYYVVYIVFASHATAEGSDWSALLLASTRELIPAHVA